MSKKVFIVTHSGFDEYEIVRAFLDREEAEEFAATFSQHEEWVDIEEVDISITAPEPDVWWEVKFFNRGHHTGPPHVKKVVYWSDVQYDHYPQHDPAIQVIEAGDKRYSHPGVIVWSRDKMTAESVLSNKVGQLWGQEAEDAMTAERKRRAMEFGAMFGSLLGKMQQ